MTYTNMFLTLGEAASLLNTSEAAVIREAADDNLSVCFEVRTELFGVEIKKPDGSIERVTLLVPIKGVVKSLTPPGPPLTTSNDTLSASLIEIIYAGSKSCRSEAGPPRPDDPEQRPVPILVASNFMLPTDDDARRTIKDGYSVTGWIDFVEKPSSVWLFHRDDLSALADMPERGEAPTPEKGAPTGTTKPPADWMESARAIADECFDHDTNANPPVRDSLATKNAVGQITGGYCFRTMSIMQVRGVNQPRS